MAQTKIKSGQLDLSGAAHGTDGQALLSNADGTMRWGDIQVAGPGYTSLDYPGTTTALNAAGGQTLIINGSGYDANTTVTFGTTSVTAISVLSATQLSVTTPALANGTYDLVLGNAAGGTTTESNVIIYNATPSWTTAAGSLGSVEKDATANFTVTATEPDGGAITYAITSGALPTGLSLNTSSGAITGTATPSISSDTTYNFTITATDDENQTNARAFSIEVTVPLSSERFEVITYTGNGSTQKIEGGKILRGAEFNGSSSKIQINQDTIGINDFSVSMWFNTSSLSSIQYLHYLHNYGVFIDTSGYINFYTNSNLIYSTAISTNTWYHVALVKSSTTGKFIYLNGSQVAADATDTGNVSSSFSGYSKAYIGAGIYNASTDWRWFSGKIDQVRIFNKAISSSEVTTLYQEDDYTSTTKSTTDIFSDGSGVALYEFENNANATISTVTDTHYFFIGDLGNQLTDVRVNTVSSEFTYTPPSGYSDWGGALDPNNTSGSQTFTFSESDKRWTKTQSGYYNSVWSTTAHNSGKYYFEIEFLNLNIQFGISKLTTADNWTSNVKNNSIVYLDYNTNSYEYSTTNLSQGQIIYGASDGTSVIGIACDFDSRTFDYYYNNSLVDTATISSTNLNGTASNVTFKEGTKFSPDLLWIKNRDSASYSHRLFDSVRGVDKTISSDATSAEYDGGGSGYMSSFDSNGFTLNSGNANTNASSNDYVSWCFNAGTGSAAQNSDGTITSTVKANAGAGFSIVKWTGNGTNGATIGHGLSNSPEIIITKGLSNATSWVVGIGGISGFAVNDYLTLTTAAKGSLSTFYQAYSTDTFQVGVSSANEMNKNSSNDYISYCFHSVDDYQKIGSYTGATPSQPIVETGFQPAFIMIKRTDTAGYNWNIYDNERDSVNPNEAYLEANTSDAEATGRGINFLSNGFQLYGTSAGINASGGTYIYLAIAADPDITQPTQANSFDVVTYTGNGSSQDIETDFKPDLVWIKNRNSTQSHRLYDSIRGANLQLSSNQTAAEGNSGGLTSFNSNGFSLDNWSSVNTNSNTYVAWCWKAADHDDSLPAINTTGTIDSLVSANQNAGFSIVKYRGTGSVGATVGHGLSSAPELYIIKETSAADDWMTIAKIGSSYQRAKLNTTDAFSTAMSGVTNSVDPTSTVITLGNSGSVNQSGQNYIAYFFHSVTGHSKIGTYSGTGSAGNAQNIGFAPRFVMVKSYSGGTSNWAIFDTSRDGFKLNANDNSADYADVRVDLTSTGFQFTGSAYNSSGVNWIYLAFK